MFRKRSRSDLRKYIHGGGGGVQVHTTHSQENFNQSPDDVNSTLDQSRSERQETYDFMKAIKVLMQRNTTDLEKIRDLFQKYGYQPLVKDNSGMEEVCKDFYTELFPACIGKTSVPKDPLRNPQLSDFGLSQYAFSRTWDVMDVQSQTNMHKEDSRNRIPTDKQTPYIMPKTPKCTLKMDDYECLTPKLEHFGISEHTMCLNEDYTMALINKNYVKLFLISIILAVDCMASPLLPVFCTPGLKIPFRKDNTILPKSPKMKESDSLPEIDGTVKQHKEDCAPPILSSDKYLEHLRRPSLTKISDYENLINTPPPPEITKIPEDILQVVFTYLCVFVPVESAFCYQISGVERLLHFTRFESGNSLLHSVENV
uniref:Uncharacterized protein n=1 Tax=Chelydra serpentina TaxID=8475 RepID=A0A8C3RP54_CHESE